jgi:hypothetical protein
MNPIVRTLFVAWQEPESRRIFPIARLTRRRSGEYELAYIEAVRAAQARGFVGLPGLEDIERVHVSAQLPALFENRSASRGRPRGSSSSYSKSNNVEPAALSGEALDAAPITVFVRRAPGDAPERLEAFSAPLRDPAGRRWGVFDARGVGRVPGSAEVLQSLQPHERVTLRAEPDNLYNPHALVIVRANQSELGYVPDYLANELARAGGGPEQLELEVLGAQRLTFPPAAPVYRVTCRYSCSAELGRLLFASESYRPVAARAQPSSNSAV